MLRIPVQSTVWSPNQLNRAFEGDAGADLCAQRDEWLDPGARCLMPTGLRMAIPEGHVGLVCPRSGLAAKKGVTVLNAPGVVDAGYRGDVGVVLINLGDEQVWVQPGDAVAQLLIVQLTPVEFVQTTELPESARDTAGFGSTGR